MTNCVDKIAKQYKRDKDGNLTQETIEKLVDEAISKNPIIYKRLAEI